MTIGLATVAKEAAKKVDPTQLHEITFNFDLIAKYDGWAVAMIGMAVVFVGLIVIWLFFETVGRQMVATREIRLKREAKAKEEGGAKLAEIEYSEDVNVAIAMALYLFLNEHHDDESGLLTLEKIERRYSPWSSKIYNMTRRPIVK